jgi:NAD(P)-dependent dehydrogenase (short-subunit alcohol dehydrogenase family)
MVKLAREAPTTYIVLEVTKMMQPKRSDSSGRGFFGGLTEGLFGARGAAIVAKQGELQPQLAYGVSGNRGSGRLLGRKALITGGNTGAGRAAAIAFAREGADVAFTYLPMEQSEADEVAQIIRQAGRKAVPLPGDLQDEVFCIQLVNDAARQLGGLDILVTNASRQQAIADIAEMSTEQFDATFKANIYAMFWLTKAALPHMGEGSSIINTSSISGHDPSDILLDYSATKGAIMVFTKSLAKQLAHRGIRVNAVAPGPIWTPLQSSSDLPASGDQAASENPEFDAETAADLDGERVELASTYVLLASNESSYATGQIYGVVGAGGS